MTDEEKYRDYIDLELFAKFKEPLKLMELERDILNDCEVIDDANN